MFDEKATELIVRSELLSRKLTPFIPLLDDGIDIIVKSKKGITELQVKSNNASKEETREQFVFNVTLFVNNNLLYALADLHTNNI